jgi:hypothetical protein
MRTGGAPPLPRLIIKIHPFAAGRVCAGMCLPGEGGGGGGARFESNEKRLAYFFKEITSRLLCALLASGQLKTNDPSLCWILREITDRPLGAAPLAASIAIALSRVL